MSKILFKLFLNKKKYLKNLRKNKPLPNNENDRYVIYSKLLYYTMKQIYQNSIVCIEEYKQMSKRTFSAEVL